MGNTPQNQTIPLAASPPPSVNVTTAPPAGPQVIHVSDNSWFSREILFFIFIVFVAVAAFMYMKPKTYSTV